MRMRRIVICGLSGSAVFLHIISQMERFSENKLFNIKCVFSFSLQRLSETLFCYKKNYETYDQKCIVFM
jgi:hypothetical protein